jgi:hypothetical protein
VALRTSRVTTAMVLRATGGTTSRRSTWMRFTLTTEACLFSSATRRLMIGGCNTHAHSPRREGRKPHGRGKRFQEEVEARRTQYAGVAA